MEFHHAPCAARDSTGLEGKADLVQGDFSSQGPCHLGQRLKSACRVQNTLGHIHHLPCGLAGALHLLCGLIDLADPM
ncbi:hypothetical protein [Corallococcus exiguus]|uniref:hypothetical protein n=1 Tax=Corallococcus exiguus TaxID=83462 RepID=UPI0020A6CF11|nr:hypothetical protein [Corallococcus exiguus]